MRVIALFHDEDMIRKIITSLNIWDFQRKSPHAPPNDRFQIYGEPSLPSIDDHLKEPEYPAEANF